MESKDKSPRREARKIPLEGWSFNAGGELQSSSRPTRLSVSEPLREYLQLFLSGQTIQEAAKSFLSRGRRFSFIRAIDTLRFLVEANVLTDPGWVRWFGRFRSKWRWPIGLLQTALQRKSLKVLPYREPAENYQWYLLCLVGVLASAAFSGLRTLSASSITGGGGEALFWAPLFLPVTLFFSSGLRILIDFGAQAFAATCQRELFLVLTPLGFRFQSTRAHFRRLTPEHFLLEGVLLFTPVILLGLLSWFFDLRVLRFSSIFFALILLEDLSPFKESRLTDWLNTFYDRRLRQAPSLKQRKGTLEQLVWVRGVLDLFWIGLAVYLVGIRLIWAWPLILLFAVFWVQDIARSVGASRIRSSAETWWRKKREKDARAGIEKDTIRQLPFFSVLDQGFFDEMIGEAKRQKRRRGTAVFHQGERSRDIYVLLEGRASVYRRYSDGKSRWVTELEPYALFGEGGYFLDRPSAAEVFCETDCVFLRIGFSKKITESLKNGGSGALQKRVATLEAMAEAEIFRELPGETTDILHSVGRTMVVPDGRTVFAENDQGDGCYLVVDGEVEVKGKEKTHRLSKGAILGEMTLLDPGLKRSSNCSAIGETTLLFFPNERFFNLLTQNLPLALTVERLVEAHQSRNRKR